MPPCIYCGAPANSAEHWLPRALGAIKGTTLLRDRICHDCNQAFGRVLDEELLRTGPTGFFRSALGIKGRRGHTSVSPFYYRGRSAVQPTAMTMPAPHGRYTILAEVGPDEAHGKAGRPLRQLVLEKADGSVECVPFHQGWQSEQIRDAITSRQLDGAELVELSLGEKVAFHYFLWASTTCRGDEPEFDPIRRFIRTDEGDWHAFVQPVSAHFVGPLRDGYLPAQPTHYLFAELNIREVVSRVQFFVGPDTNPPTPSSAIRLGDSPARIDARWLVAHQIRYYDEKTDGYDAEIEAVDVTPSRIVIPGPV